MATQNTNPRDKTVRTRDPRDNYINEEISDRKMGGIDINTVIRLIVEGKPPVMVKLTDARKRAYEAQQDLVLIDAKNEVPVCKIMDYGRFKYERDKREKEAKKKQKIIETKEIQLTPQIGSGDFDTKVSSAIRFLQDGNKVKVVIKYRGRQMAHQELGVALLEKFKVACAEHGTPEKDALMEGRNLITTLTPAKKG